MTSQEDSKTASTEYLPILNMQPNKSFCNRRRCIIFSILVAILLVWGTIALILILTTGKSGGGGKDDPIEDNRPLNMFKFVNKQVSFCTNCQLDSYILVLKIVVIYSKCQN